MRSAYSIATATLLLALCGCGNKGDLYLDPTDLSDEQKALLGELNTPPEQGDPGNEVNELPQGDGADLSVDPESDEAKAAKNKKQTNNEGTNQ